MSKDADWKKCSVNPADKGTRRSVTWTWPYISKFRVSLSCSASSRYTHSERVTINNRAHRRENRGVFDRLEIHLWKLINRHSVRTLHVVSNIFGNVVATRYNKTGRGKMWREKTHPNMIISFILQVSPPLETLFVFLRFSFYLLSKYSHSFPISILSRIKIDQSFCCFIAQKRSLKFKNLQKMILNRRSRFLWFESLFFVYWKILGNKLIVVANFFSFEIETKNNKKNLCLYLYVTLVPISPPYFYFFFPLVPYLFVFLTPRTMLFLSPLKYRRRGFISV